jgi:protein phosphatase
VAIIDWYTMSEHAGLPHNDDCVLAEPGYGVFLVADGMGGRPGGAQASRVAARAFMDYLRRVNPSAIASPVALRQAVEAANAAVREVVRADARMAGMGTTLSAVILSETGGRIAHVGDSRIYRLSRGRLEQLTEDHTLVSELVARRMLSKTDAGGSPLGHILSRAIGTRPAVDPDIIDLDLGGDDWLLLCTDGFYKAVPADRVQALAASAAGSGAQAMCRDLVRAAFDAGPQDNVTLAVVRRVQGR